MRINRKNYRNLTFFMLLFLVVILAAFRFGIAAEDANVPKETSSPETSDPNKSSEISENIIQASDTSNAADPNNDTKDTREISDPNSKNITKSAKDANEPNNLTSM